MKKAFTILLMILIGGFGGYFYYKYSQKNKENNIISEAGNITNTPETVENHNENAETSNTEEPDGESPHSGKQIDETQLDDESLKKWKGEYYLEYFDEKSKSIHPIKLSLKIDAPDVSSILIWRYDEDKQTDKEAAFSGEFWKMGNENNELDFILGVQSGVFEGKNESTFFLSEKDGRFFIRTNYLDKNDAVLIKKIK